MEESVYKVQNAFKLTELNLEYLEKKINTEFVDATADGQDAKENPGELLERIAEVKRDYAEILREVDEIKRLQLEAVDYFRVELMQACQSLHNLQLNTGIQPPPELSCDEELNEAKQVLDLPDVNDSYSTSTQNNDHQPNHTDTESKSQQSRTVSKPTEFEQINKSPYTKRKNCSDFMEITTEEFNSVSTLVRGRVKLGDVNRTYKILWEHFKQNPSSEALTPSDMDKMSLRVTGNTGEAKLKVLRSLKLLQISKKGDVHLL